MQKSSPSTPIVSERLICIVERCLESQAAYQLFDMLAGIAGLDLRAKTEYLRMIRVSGAFDEEEIGAIERLIVSGAAQEFKETIDRVRQARIECEIDRILVN